MATFEGSSKIFLQALQCALGSGTRVQSPARAGTSAEPVAALQGRWVLLRSEQSKPGESAAILPGIASSVGGTPKPPKAKAKEGLASSTLLVGAAFMQ